MQKRYFVLPDGTITGEVFVDEPANPEGLQIVSCEDLGDHTKWRWAAGSPVAKAPSLEEKKAARALAVATLKVTTASGKTFDGDETSQGRMTRAIMAGQIAGLTDCTWVLADNTPTTVTLAELQEALALAIQAQGAIWAEPYL